MYKKSSKCNCSKTYICIKVIVKNYDINMDKKLIIREKLSVTFNYSEFKEYSEKIISTIHSSEQSSEEKYLNEYRKLNLARINRVEKTYDPSDKIKTIISGIQKQIWVVITEDWCGDSAQNLPAIAKIASLSENIILKIVFRDQNLDLMDLYLTDGKRSIPKLIALDEELNEIFTWGPRPQKAQEYFDNLKNQGLVKEEIIKEIHSWYAKDKCLSLENEFIELISQNIVLSKNM